MRIPTLLAMALLVLALTAATVLFLFKQNQNKKSPPPINITVSNISANEVVISWQTEQPSVGKVSYGESGSLGNESADDRDKILLKSYYSHFVTLKGLTENTTYYFKVESNSSLFPEKNVSFKTAKNLPDNPDIKNFNKPLIGVILSSNLEPIDEAVITLKASNASPLSTLTTTAGNFILPLLDLKLEDLSDFLVLDHTTPAVLSVERGSVKSEVKLNLPFSGNLPKIVLGQNSDLTSLVPPSASPSAQDLNPLDLNGDGRINSFDLSLILQNLGKKSTDPTFNKATDLNQDGVIDQKDVDLMKKAIQQ